MITQAKDFRYMVKNNKLVVMTQDEECQWLSNLLAIEVKKHLDISNPEQKEFFLVQEDNLIQLKLQELIEMAIGFGIDCEAIEDHPRFFHLNDKFGNSHGFDTKYFETRNQTILNSFAAIILEYFECGNQQVIPILLTTYPDSKLGDSLILVSNNPGLAPFAQIMDYTHPQYISTIAKLQK